MLFGKHLNRYYLRYAPMLLLGLAALLSIDYAQLMIPRLYRILINGMNNGNVEINGSSVPFDMDLLLDKICLPMFLILIGMLIGRFLWRVCFIGAGIRTETDLRARMFDRCLLLSQDYYQKNKVGDLMSLFTNDLESVQDCFSWGIMMFSDAVFLGILAVLKMMRMNWVLTLFTLIPMGLLLAMSMVLGRYLTKTWDRRQEAFSKLSDFSQENFSGIAVIKAFVKEFKELYAFRELNKENEKANVEHTKASTLLHILVMLFVESVICIILGYGGWLAYGGKFNAGELVEFIGYFTSIIWPVMAVSELIEMRSKGKASLDRIGKLLEAEPTVRDIRAEETPQITGGIEFRHLTFRYPGASFDVLDDVSFTVRPGENVGIIGRTGSGKTTLVDLILRTSNVPDGTLFIDGTDINRIPIEHVRAAVAYVPQDSFLFSETIAKNIAFASDSEDAEAIENAAKMADIHDNITEFSKKYETVLGERGVTVSGGQKQRISIARALMKDAVILILDDAVSAVDLKTEKRILEELRENRRGKTTLLIAHRISTIEKMDKIVFLDEGKVLAVGTHEALYRECAPYREMVDLQKLDDLEGGGSDA